MRNEEEASSQPHHLSKRTIKHHGGIGVGTSCTVKGSYCSCHYCRCDMGLIHCVKHGATTFNNVIGIGKRIIVITVLVRIIIIIFLIIEGKNYCYGHMEGEHCHCDYCKCKHGYGAHGGKHGGCGGGGGFF